MWFRGGVDVFGSTGVGEKKLPLTLKSQDGHTSDMDLSSYAAVLLDLDGTLYHDEHCLPGARELVHLLQARQQPFACLSNGTASPNQLVQRLARMGMDINPDRIYTAAVAAADYVLSHYATPRVFNLATEGLTDLLDGKVAWIETADQACDAVIVGPPTGRFAMPLDRQRIALQLLRAGAQLIGICADRLYPSPRGIEFGSGALTAMLAYAANVRPIFCGKPEPLFFNELCSRLKVAPHHCVLIGDNLEADIAGAKAVGMATILVLTGIARRQDLVDLSGEKHPDAVIDNLLAII